MPARALGSDQARHPRVPRLALGLSPSALSVASAQGSTDGSAMRPLPAQPPGRRTSKLKHGDGTNRALASIRPYGRNGAALPPTAAKRPFRGLTPSPRPEPTSPNRPFLPLTAFSLSPHLPRPKKALLRTLRRHTTLSPAPPSIPPTLPGARLCRLGLSALEHGGTQQLSSTAALQPRRRESRLPRLARPLACLAAHHDKQPIEHSPPIEIPPLRPASQREGSLQ